MNADHKTPSSNPLTWKKIGLILLVVAIAAYQYYQQENNVANHDAGPAVADASEQSSGGSGNRDRTDTETTAFFTDGPRGSKISPAGLEYTRTGHGEHRTDHVLRHAEDIPDRQGSHGVFAVDSDEEVFALIDEAYELIKQDSNRVDKEPSRGDGKQAYVVDMKRKIGFKGGQSGRRSGNPPLTRIKLVLADNRVITAYPY